MATTTRSDGSSRGPFVMARQLRADIDHVLRPREARGESVTDELERRARRGGLVAWRAMKRHPFVSVAVLGLGGVAAAAVVGAGELAFGVAVALAAYKVLREGEPPLQAIEEVAKEARG